MIDKKRLIRLTKQLIRINSENPPGDESRIACFVERYLVDMGLKTKVYAFKKNRSNVVSILPGKDKKRTLLITPHLDTVPAGKNWRHRPFSGSVEGGRLYGLGATDCKGNLAAGLEAVHSIVEEGISLGYNLIFAATADEESGSGQGLIPLLEKGILRPDAAVVLDSDDFEIIITQKGLMHLKVKLEGKKAHGAYPWLGVNAAVAAARIISEITSPGFVSSKDNAAWGRRSVYLRPPTVNVGTVHAGDKVNVVADWCEFELDLRYLPGGNADKILSRIKALVSRHAPKYSFEIEGIQDPYKIDKNHPLVQQLVRAVKTVGLKPAIKGSEGATTITFFQHRGIPAVATGVGCQGCAHIADEYVSMRNLYKGAQALESFLKYFSFHYKG